MALEYPSVPFQLFQTVWIGRFGKTAEYLVLGQKAEIFSDKSKWRIFITVQEIGDTTREEISLSDYGVSGHAYDNRPVQIHANKMDAEKAALAHQEWFDTHPPIRFPSWDA